MRFIFLLLLLPGCMRSGLTDTQSVDCMDGTRAVVDYTVYCVMPSFTPCPEELPFAYDIAARTVCAEVDDAPEGALLAAARHAAGFKADAEVSPDRDVRGFRN